MQHCNSGTLHDKEFTTLNHCVDTIDDCCAGSELGEAWRHGPAWTWMVVVVVVECDVVTSNLNLSAPDLTQLDLTCRHQSGHI